MNKYLWIVSLSAVLAAVGCGNEDTVIPLGGQNDAVVEAESESTAEENPDSKPDEEPVRPPPPSPSEKPQVCEDFDLSPVNPVQTTDCPTQAEPRFSVGDWQAEYYRDDTLVAEETVERASINYPWSDFHGIQSEQFRAKWTSIVTVFEPVRIGLQVNISWSDASIFIDGEEVASYTNQDLGTVYVDLDVGDHDIVTTLANGWHTVEYNLTLTEQPQLSARQAAFCMADALANVDEVVYASGYAPDDRYNVEKVTIAPRSETIFVVLSAYETTHWVIDNPHGVNIAGIAYDSFDPGSTVTADPSIPQFSIENIPFALKTLDEAYAYAYCQEHNYCPVDSTVEYASCFIENLFGKAPSSTVYSYYFETPTL